MFNTIASFGEQKMKRATIDAPFAALAETRRSRVVFAQQIIG